LNATPELAGRSGVVVLVPVALGYTSRSNRLT
jgi:hypothetical protein